MSGVISCETNCYVSMNYCSAINVSSFYPFIKAVDFNVFYICNCVFTNISSSVRGGAISMVDSNMTMQNVTFNNCSALGAGGAISFEKITENRLLFFLLNYCFFYNCSSLDDDFGGGAIFFDFSLYGVTH
jgi:hypothetical protein